MTENQEKINQLIEKLDALVGKQEVFSREITVLREEIFSLKTSEIDRSLKTEEVLEHKQAVFSEPGVKEEKGKTSQDRNGKAVSS